MLLWYPNLAVLTKTNKNCRITKHQRTKKSEYSQYFEPFFFEGFIEEREKRYKYINIVKKRPPGFTAEPEYRLTVHSRRALPQLKRATLWIFTYTLTAGRPMIYAHPADKLLSAVQWNTQTMSAKYQKPISVTYLFACVKSVAGWLIPP